MEKILKVCVEGASCVDSKYICTDKVLSDELDHQYYWYLHGKLFRLIGYDIPYATNCKSAGYSKQMLNCACIRGSRVERLRSEDLYRWSMCIDGIIPVRVHGIDEPCIGYFWIEDHRIVTYLGEEYKIWEQRGLVCLESDTKGREDALSEYNKWSRHDKSQQL